MSIFDAAPGGGDDAATTPDAETETVETISDAPETQEPVAVPVPPPRLSRRAQAAEDAKKREAELERKFQERDTQRENELSRLRTELAMRPVHTVQAPAPAQPQVVDADPDELQREALRMLDNKDMDGYHRKLRESHLAATRRELAPRFAQQQQPQHQIAPETYALMAQYNDVVSMPNGMQIAINEDNKLGLMGHPPGPARVHAAFQSVRQMLTATKKPGGPQYSQQAAGVLGSAPTGRSSGQANTNNSPSIMMSADEERTARSIAKKAGMSWEEYVTDLATHRPEMVRR